MSKVINFLQINVMQKPTMEHEMWPHSCVYLCKCGLAQLFTFVTISNAARRSVVRNDLWKCQAEFMDDNKARSQKCHRCMAARLAEY